MAPEAGGNLTAALSAAAMPEAERRPFEANDLLIERARCQSGCPPGFIAYIVRDWDRVLSGRALEISRRSDEPDFENELWFTQDEENRIEQRAPQYLGEPSLIHLPIGYAIPRDIGLRVAGHSQEQPTTESCDKIEFSDVPSLDGNPETHDYVARIPGLMITGSATGVEAFEGGGFWFLPGSEIRTVRTRGDARESRITVPRTVTFPKALVRESS
jgi:hypothetical protein